ncbi:MAG: hypothetical protein ACRD3D_13075 [Terriglobia bacterium]
MGDSHKRVCLTLPPPGNVDQNFEEALADLVKYALDKDGRLLARIEGPSLVVVVGFAGRDPGFAPLAAVVGEEMITRVISRAAVK